MTPKEYLKKLNLKQSKNPRKIISDAKQLPGVDAELIEEIMNCIDRRANDIRAISEQEFYSIKNKDYKTSIAFTGLFSANYIERALEYISAFELGETILDIGCDNGIITCYIALNNPKSKVTGIDLNESSIAVARKLAEDLGLTNIEFTVDSIEKHQTKYDTVISSRTVAEFSAPYEKGIEKKVGDPLPLQIKEEKKIFKKYARCLANLVGESFISLERLDYDHGYLSYLVAMNEVGLVPEFKSLYCMLRDECGAEPDTARIQAITFDKKVKISETEIIDGMVDLILAEFTFDDMHFEEFAADAVLWKEKCKLIEGWVFYATNGKVKSRNAKQALYVSATNPNKIYHRAYVPPEFDCLDRINSKEIDDHMAKLKEYAKKCRSIGLEVKKAFV